MGSGGAEVAQPFHASLHDVAKSPKVFIKTDAVIAFAGLQHLWERAAIPGKPAAVDNYAADRRSVAADELGSRMQNDVRAMLYGPA